MGQFHYTVNLDKKEFINPHKIGLGLKLREQFGRGCTGDVLLMLLACSNGRGGGDVTTSTKGLVGRWTGDRIAVVGDYSEPDDIPGTDAEQVYDDCQEGEYKDISDDICILLNEQFGLNLDIKANGWRRR